MTTIQDLINPPSLQDNDESKYKLATSNFDLFRIMSSLSNPSKVDNPDFSTLSSQGVSPTTQADGDNFEFIKYWYVVGSTQATYQFTATQYPQNSTVQSNSNYFMNCKVFTYSGDGLYFYQRLLNKVRCFQNSYLTITVSAFNNNPDPIKLRIVCNYNYGPSSELIESRPLYLEEGYNNLYVSISTPSLNGKTVNSSNYVEFRIDFDNLPGGVADFELYLVKVEFGEMSTNLP